MASKLLEANFDFDDGLEKFATKIEEKVMLSGLAAAAEVFYDEVKLNVSGVRGHPKVVTGNLSKSIYRYYDEKQSTPTLKSYFVSWNKKTAPHGHLIEFGTSTAPAYPFVRPAFDRAKDAGDAALARMTQLLSGK